MFETSLDFAETEALIANGSFERMEKKNESNHLRNNAVDSDTRLFDILSATFEK